MAPYSMDLRTRVLADCDAGLAAKEVAAKFRVSRSWVNRLVQRRRETGQVGPRQQAQIRAYAPKKMSASAGNPTPFSRLRDVTRRETGGSNPTTYAVRSATTSLFARCESRHATSVFSPLGVVSCDLTA